VGGRVFLASVGFSMNGGARWDDESWLVGGGKEGDKAKVMEDGFYIELHACWCLYDKFNKPKIL
jgi:hypothetical protein